MKTVIIGATPNPSRYAFIAAKMLDEGNFEFVPVGIKSGKIFGRAILDLREKPTIEDVHTVTLYIGPQNQPEWYDYMLSLNPKRIIFNPGTENSEFMDIAKKNGAEVEAACTVVLFFNNSYWVLF